MNTAAPDLPLELGPTPTYVRRTADWVADGPGEGTLTVRLWRRASAPPETDVYRVEEVPAVCAAGRAFLLVNVFDDSQPDVYETFVGRERLCTCTAGAVKRHECKHVAALRALAAGGRL